MSVRAQNTKDPEGEEEYMESSNTAAHDDDRLKEFIRKPKTEYNLVLADKNVARLKDIRSYFLNELYTENRYTITMFKSIEEAKTYAAKNEVDAVLFGESLCRSGSFEDVGGVVIDLLDNKNKDKKTVAIPLYEDMPEEPGFFVSGRSWKTKWMISAIILPLSYKYSAERIVRLAEMTVYAYRQDREIMMEYGVGRRGMGYIMPVFALTEYVLKICRDEDFLKAVSRKDEKTSITEAHNLKNLASNAGLCDWANLYYCMENALLTKNGSAFEETMRIYEKSKPVQCRIIFTFVKKRIMELDRIEGFHETFCEQFKRTFGFDYYGSAMDVPVENNDFDF